MSSARLLELELELARTLEEMDGKNGKPANDFEDPEVLLRYCKHARVRWLKRSYLLETYYSRHEHGDCGWCAYGVDPEDYPGRDLAGCQHLFPDESCELPPRPILPRCQDLPVQAFATDSELAEWVKLRSDDEVCQYAGSRHLMSVSHPWWGRGAPDPKGKQLHAIARFICFGSPGSEREFAPVYNGIEAIFFDWSCLPQQPGRTTEDNMYFAMALADMHLLYTHDSTIVLRLDMPVPLSAENAESYENRGWCVFERRVAQMSKAESFSRVQSLEQYYRWTDDAVVRVMCDEEVRSPEVEIPPTPNEFRAQLHFLKFTAKATDIAIVGNLYEKVYKGRFGDNA